MYLKIKTKKIEIKELVSFWDRFISLKFVFDPIDYGVLFSNKNTISTTFFCQKVDVVLTDKDNNILFLYKSFPYERRIWQKKDVYNIYFLPLGTVDNLNIGERLNIKK